MATLSNFANRRDSRSRVSKHLAREKTRRAPEMTKHSSELEPSSTADDLRKTELTLGPPGESRDEGGKSGMKRGISRTLNLLNLRGSTAAIKRDHICDEQLEQEASSTPKPPGAKAQLVGWPPVRPWRKTVTRRCNYVKVAVDGAPYLRKVDLGSYGSYDQLLKALKSMFSCFTACNYSNDGKLMDPVNGSEYLPTYEDKDGDWMMVGDVPWKMFAETCNRIRLMKSSEAVGLGCRLVVKYLKLL
ncbi:hypothetical protein Ancab_011986 [Ancistrocladus abbreviatus]